MREPWVKPLTAEDREKHLRKIENTRDELAQKQAELDDAIRIARVAGVTWTDIGVLFGITRQAAWERFRKLVKKSD